MLDAGKQDVFQYIADCKRFGATQLDLWNAQLTPIRNADHAIKASLNAKNASLTPEDNVYLQQVRTAAGAAGMPFGCIAVDGCHIYEPDGQMREMHVHLADRWLRVAEILGAPQVRIDAGGPQEMPDDVFTIIVAGYRDLVTRAHKKNIEILMENHWGPTVVPENVVRILQTVDGLGLLFDSCNWAGGMHEEGWAMCAKYARSTHFKTFRFDAEGNDPTLDNPTAIRRLVEAGYSGCWGIESVPDDGDEYGAVEKTRNLIRRTLTQLGALETPA